MTTEFRDRMKVACSYARLARADLKKGKEDLAREELRMALFACDGARAVLEGCDPEALRDLDDLADELQSIAVAIHC